MIYSHFGRDINEIEFIGLFFLIIRIKMKKAYVKSEINE